MRQLASALKKLEIPPALAGGPGARPASPHFRLASLPPVGHHDHPAGVEAAAWAELVESASDWKGRPIQRFDPPQEVQGPHVDRSPVLLPALRDAEPPTGKTPHRFRHQYEKIVAQMRERGTSRRSSIVALLGVSESAATAELLRDLAECLVQQGEGPVLMVDGNFWDRSLSSLCGCGGAQGFSDVLAGWPWQNTLVRLAEPNITLLPAGSGFVQRMDGLSWGGLMDEWRDAYRWVLLDGGPASAWLAEGLCSACDQLILHSQVDQASSVELRAAVKRIRRLGGRLVGSIFTGHDWKQAV